MRGRPVEGDQVREPVDLIDEARAELPASRDHRRPRCPREPPGDERQDDPRGDEEAGERQAERHVQQAQAERDEQQSRVRRRSAEARPARRSPRASRCRRRSGSAGRRSDGSSGGPERAARSRRRTRHGGRPGSRTSRGGSLSARSSGTSARPIARTRTAVMARATSATFETSAAFEIRKADTPISATFDATARNAEKCPDDDPAALARGQVQQPSEGGHESPPASSVARSRRNGPSRLRQVRRRTHLDDPPMVHDGDDVGDRHESKAVRHHQDCPVARPCAPTASRTSVFAGRVQMRGRLVEDDQAGAREERPREGEALALPAAEPDPVLPDRRVVASGHRVDERGRAGLTRRGADLLARRVRSRESDVVRDGAVEEVRPLWHPRDV